jgi:hypothetical protein
MGKWDGIKSQKIIDALQNFSQSLAADLDPGAPVTLTHENVVNGVSAALGDGVLTPSELKDLRIVADMTMTGRSFLMLRYLIEQTPKIVGAEGLFSLTTAGERVAADNICDFLKRTGHGFFPPLDRDRVGIDLLLRVGNPEIMNQNPAGLCGPLAFLYNFASDKPLDYANFALKLYENGSAKIGDMLIEPSKGCRNYSPPSSMSPADWLTAASLRDSENWWFDVDDADVGFSAGTSIDEIEKWFDRAGYKDVESEDHAIRNLNESDLALLNRYFGEGRRVVLRINSKLLYADTQSKTTHKGNHVVVLRSPIAYSSSTVFLTVYTWGNGKFRIPQGGVLSEADFLNDLYGYVAGKPY